VRRNSLLKKGLKSPARLRLHDIPIMKTNYLVLRIKVKVGDISIPCFVLDDGRRVISGRGMTQAIGMKGRGQGIARIATLKVLKSYENNSLLVAINNAIRFTGGSPKVDVPSDGFEATVL